MVFYFTDQVRWVLKVAAFVALVAAILVVSQTSLASQHDLIRTAIAVDLFLTVPAAYFLLIRKSSIPRMTILPLLLACFFLGSAIVPNGLAIMAIVGTVLVPAIEVLLLGFMVLRIFRIRKAYAAGKGSGLDLMENLRKALESELRPSAVARAVAFEAGMLAYLCVIWRAPDGSNFTYHRRNSPRLLLTVLLFPLLVETIGIHLLIALWSPTISWIATALSAYLCVQLLAHFKAMSVRPITLTDDSLMLRCGILGDMLIPRGCIKRVSAVDNERTEGLDLLPLGALSQANVQIELSEPATAYGLYGIRKQIRLVRITVDDPVAFMRSLSS